MRKTIRVTRVILCMSACCILFASWLTGCGSYGATTLPDDIQVAEITQENII
jgi:predicted small lipoprotein YifL